MDHTLAKTGRHQVRVLQQFQRTGAGRNGVIGDSEKQPALNYSRIVCGVGNLRRQQYPGARETTRKEVKANPFSNPFHVI